MRKFFFFNLFIVCLLSFSQLFALTFTAGSESGNNGSQVVVPITVKDFNDIISMQGTIEWDENIASFSSIEQYGLSGLSSSNFGTTQSSNGILTFSWYESNLSGITLSNNTVLFAIKFNLVGSAGQHSDVNITNSPTPIEVINESFSVVSVTTVSGDIDITTTLDPCTTNPPSVSLGSDIVLCNGLSETLSAGSGFSSYSWSTGAITSSISVSTAATYYVTVTDNNGCTASDTVVVSMAGSGCDELFISEYVEGSSNNKAIEIYNPTSSTIDLSTYKIVQYSNGSTTVSATISLSGIIAAKDVFVITHSSAVSTLKALADLTSGSLSYNGNDVIALTRNGVIIDQVGAIGQSSIWTVGTGSTENYTLVRKNAVTAGQTNWTTAATEWDVYASDTYTYLGSHTSSCSNSNSSTASAGADVSICNGESTTLNASGGTSYQWYSSSSLSSITIANPTASPTTTTTYTVSITDLNGCTTVDQVTVTVNNSPTLVTSSTNETNGQADGSATVTASGGSSPYTYSWSNGKTSSSISGLAAGTYTVTVTDANGCDVTAIVTITNTTTVDPCTTNPPSVNLGGDFTLCNGLSETLSAGSGFSSYSWSTGAITSSISVSNAGTYYVTVTDNNGCTASDTVVVSTVGSGCNELFISEYVEGSSNNKAIEIYNPTNSSIDLSAYKIVQYTNGSTSVSTTISLSGTIASKDVFVLANSSASSTLKALADLTSGSLSYNGNDVVGLSKNGGLIDQIGQIGQGTSWPVGSGSTENYTLVRKSTVTTGQTNWTTGAMEWDIYASDTYSYLGSHSSSCTNSNSSTASAGTDVAICNGENTTLNASGGTSYQWNSSSTLSSLTIANPVAEPKTTTTYIVSIIDGNGCLTTDSVTVTVNQLPSLSTSSTNSTNGQADGTATVVASGGTGTYTYSWNSNPVQTTSTASGLLAGTYTVTVNDGNCSVTAIVVVTDSSNVDPCTTNPPSVNLGGDFTLCNGLSETLSAGSGFISYSWSTAATTSSISVSNAGTYYVTVTDNNGCTASDTIVVSTVGSGCNELFFSEYVEGSSNNKALEIYNPTSSSIDLSAYSLHFYNNGSTAVSAIISLSGTIAAKDVMVITHTSASSSLMAYADLTHGYIAFNGNDAILLKNGSSIIDQIGNVGESVIWTVGTGNTENHTLVRKSTITAGQTNWTTGAMEWDVYASDTYSYLGSHTSSCTNSNSSTASAGADVAICNGENTTLNASGGTSYQWNSSNTLSSLTIANPVAEPQTTTIYVVSITDGNGCVTTDSVTVTVNASPTLSTTFTNETNGQANGSATVSVNGGTSPYAYVWSNGNTTSSLSGLSAGTYTVVVTDANGCEATATVTITNTTTVDPCTTNPPSVNLGGDFTLCNGLSETLSAGSGFISYSWSTAATTSSISVSSAGTYYVTITDGNGCTASDTVVVSISGSDCNELFISEYVEGSSNNKAVEIYNPTSAAVNLTGYKIVQYSNGSISPSSTITLSGSIGAKDVFVLTHASAASTLKALADTTSGTLSFNGNDVVTLTKNGNTIDKIGEIGQSSIWPVGSGSTENYTLVRKNSVTAGQSNWTTAATEWDVYAIDTYTNLGSHSSSCQGSTTYMISAGIDVSICKGESTTLNASGGTSYQWNSSTTLSSLTVSNPVAEPQTTTTYVVAITDGNGCVTIDSVTVSVNQLPTLATSSTNSTNGQADGTATVTATGGTGTYSYSWNTNPVQTTATATGLLAGTYTVTVNDGNCSVTATVTVSDSSTVDPCTTNPPSVNLGGDVVLCNGNTTTLSAGSGFFSYSWSTGATSSSISVSSAGTYYVTITDINGCTASDTVEVSTNIISGCNELFISEYVEGSSNNKALEIYNPTSSTINLADYKIVLYSNGSLTVSSTINLTGSIAANDVFVLTHTSASSTLKALANQTSGSLSFNGDDVVALTKTGSIIDQLGNIGQATVWTVGSGSTQDHTLVRKSSVTAGQTNWTVGAAEWDAYTLDTYSYLDSHTSSCGTSVPSAGADVTICKGESTTLNASGGTSYQWNSSFSLSNLTIANPVAEPQTTTTYVVTIIDGNGCTSIDSITVTVTEGPALTLSKTNATCGQNNGTASVSATGNSPFTYLWSNAETTSSITGLAAGKYNVTVTDANGCSVIDTVEVESPSVPVVTATATNASCGQNNGEASASVSGGKSPYAYSWSNGKTTSSISGLAVDTYIVSITDANGCTSSDTVMVGSSTGPNITVTTSNAKCGQSNGEAAASASGGKSPYTYLWSNGKTTASVSGLTAGTYTVTVTDANGCTGTATATITSTSSPSVSVITSNANCGNSNGSASASVTGGTSPFTYSWSNGKTTSSISGLATGSYTVTVTDANGCTGTATATISSTTAPSITLSTTKATCGQSNGTATAVVSGGTSPYTYSWSNGKTTSSISGLATGSYTVTVTDANGCSSSATASVSSSNGPTVIVSSSNATCGQSNGSATTTVSGGTSPYTYSWSNGKTTSSVSGLAAGTYTVTVTDANGCTTTETATIGSTSGPTVKVKTTNATCGQNNGEASTTVSGGTSPYTYSWSNGKTTSSVSGLAAGTYTVTVTDANGCTTTETATIGSTSGPTVKVTTTNATCGQSNGKASTTVSGGASPYTYSWSNGKTTSSVSGLAAGTYTVTVTDANGCTTTETAIINSSNGPSVTLKEKNEKCSQADGKIESTVSGGTSPYTYLWSNGQTTGNATNLAAGIYTLTVTDANGCQTTQTVTVGNDAGPTLTTSSTNEINGLANGTATVIASGGTGNYSYNWSTNPVQTTSTATGLVAGTYTVTVSDGNCISTSTVIVNDTNTTDPCLLNPISVDLGGDITICKGDSIILDAGVGFVSYLWLNAETTQTITVSKDGAYAVTVTDSNGCTATDEMHVYFNSYSTVNLGGDIVLCQNAITVLDAGNGYVNYSWSTGEISSSITVDTIGTYYVSVTDTNGCISSDTIVVSVNNNTVNGCNELYFSEYIEGSSNNKALEIYNPTSSVIDLSLYTVSIYTNGSTTVSSTIALKGLLAGGDVFVISNPSAITDMLNVTDLTSGSLNFNGNDVVTLSNNGLMIDKIGEIGQSTAWSVDTGSTENYTLVRDYTSTIGQTDWTIGATEWNVYAIDTYSNLGYHSSACSLFQKPEAGNDATICEGDSVQLEAKGGKTYEWYTSSSLSDTHISNPIATPTKTTTYYIDIIDGNGCKYTDSVTVNVHPLATINLGGDITLCQTSYILDAGAGYNTYLWSTGATTQTLSITSSGVYSVFATNQFGCVANDEIEVILLGTGQFVSLGNDTSICNTDPITIDAGSGFSNYWWSNGDTTQTTTLSQSGSYVVTVLDTNGCKSSDTLTLKLGAGVDLGSNKVLCDGKALTLDAGAGYSSYVWSTGATTQTITVNTAGNYAVVTIDKTNCTSLDTVEVSTDTQPSISLGNDTSVCNGNTVLIEAGLGYNSYNWSNGDTTAQTTIQTGGTYTIVVEKLNGCKSVDSIVVNEFSIAPITLGPDQSICQTQSVILEAGQGYVSYMWSTGSTDPSITVTMAGYYFVLVTDSNGCSTSAGIDVTQYSTSPVELGPDTVICQGEEIKLNAGSGYVSYSWSTGSTAQTISITTVGTYYVMVEDSNGCISTDTLHVEPCSSGISETNSKINIQLYPNPVAEQLNIIIDGNREMDKIEVYNSIGELIYVSKLTNANNASINFLIYAEGVYTIRVFSGNSIISRRVTKIY